MNTLIINQIPSGVQKSPFWATLLNPAVPLSTYLCLSPSFPLLAEQFAIQHPAYLVFGYLAVCLIQPSLWDGRMVARFRSVDFVFAAFVLIVLISWVVTGRAGDSRVIAYFLAIMAIPWMAVRLLTASQIGDIVRYTALFGSMIALGYLIAIPFMYGFDAFRERTLFFGKYVVYGVFGPTVGLLAVMSAVYLILPRAAQSERLNRAAWVMLPLSLVVIVHMGSRGMFAAAVLALLAGCAFVRQLTWKRKIAVMAVALASSIVGLASIPKNRLDHFAQLQNVRNVAQLQDVHNTWPLTPEQCIAWGANDSIAVRVQLYREAVEIFLSKPVTGAGTGRFGLESCYYRGSVVLASPHSTVLHVLSELGISGAAPFVVLNLMLLAIIWRVIRVQSSDPTLRLGCVVAAAWIYVVIYDQVSGSYLTTLYYYLFSGLLVSLYVAYRKEEKVVGVSLPAHGA